MFKKLFNKPVSDKKTETSEKNKVDKETIKATLSTTKEQLSQEENPERRIDLQNQIGDLHYKMDEVDTAIEYWEKSKEMMEKPGAAHTKLMQAYNYLQKEAWKTGDDKAGEYYAGMIENLMKHNKDSIRYGK